MKRIFKELNGWVSFALGSILFFVSPPIYRLIDPTAGRYDAGYIQPVIYAMIAVSFGSAFAWLMLRLNAPALYRAFDSFLEGDVSTLTDQSKVAIGFYIFFIVVIVTVIICMV
jgi:hypothetical protein